MRQHLNMKLIDTTFDNINIGQVNMIEGEFSKGFIYNDFIVLTAKELFNNIESIDNKEFEQSDRINLDFSNIDAIDLKAVNVLLNLQKVALLNNKTLSVSNVKPNVSQMLDATGLQKTFANLATNPITRKY